MNIVWKCKKCEKEYPSNGERLVPPVFYSNVLSTRLYSLKCTCGGEVTLCPTSAAKLIERVDILTKKDMNGEDEYMAIITYYCNIFGRQVVWQVKSLWGVAQQYNAQQSAPLTKSPLAVVLAKVLWAFRTQNR